MRLDISGKKFGKLTVVEFSHTNIHGHNVWKCLCDCGRETTAQVRFLNNGKKVSCGCKRKQLGNNHPTWQGVGDFGLAQFNRIKNSAKTRKIQFSLTIEYLWNLYQKQNKKCALSGEEITLSSSNKTWGTASLDRIDSMKGYVEGNVQWVHKDVNFMKSNLTQTRFFELISKICENTPL